MQTDQARPIKPFRVHFVSNVEIPVSTVEIGVSILVVGVFVATLWTVQHRETQLSLRETKPGFPNRVVSLFLGKGPDVKGFGTKRRQSTAQPPLGVCAWRMKNAVTVDLWWQIFSRVFQAK